MKRNAERQSGRLTIMVPIAIRARRGALRFKEHTSTVNISRGGISFRSRRRYAPGMALRVDFQSASDHSGRTQEIPAEVVRVSGSDRGGALVGARFEDAALASVVYAELLSAQTRTSLALVEVMQALSPGAEIGDVIDSICRAAARAMEAERTVVILLDKGEPTLYSQGRCTKLSAPQARLARSLLGAGRVSRQLMSIRAPAAASRFRARLEKLFKRRIRSLLSVPLSEESGVSPGLLVVLDKRHGSFTPEDEALGAAVANQVSIVLREALLFEKIRSMKSFNETLLESIAAAVVSFDRFGRLTTANRAARQIFGLHPGKDAGRQLARLLAGAANSRLRSLASAVLRTRDPGAAYDVRFLRRDQASFSLNLTAFPLEGSNGAFLGGVLVAEDITKEQRFMSTLCRYLAREVAEQVLREKDKIKLGGKRANVTVLIADIRNFTAISEKMDPAKLIDLLNAYFPRMINVIFHHQGMVDKFMGDAILAVFGVPVPRKQDALQAVRAALGMRRELRTINRKLARSGRTTLEIGIGITSGTVISGNIGSERRMDYTVIGDPVNLAARLEGLTKEVGRKILISESVRDAVARSIPCEELGVFKIRGKQEEVRVFAVSGAS